MKEDFVHTIWKYQLFNTSELKTVLGQSIKVVHPGHSHINSGPDFISSKLIIDGLLWAGNVEIHVQSSEWYQHNHHIDPAYDNVILHVVFVNNKQDCFTSNGLLLNTLVVEPFIPDSMLERYEQITSDLRSLPCKNWWSKIDSTIIEQWLMRMCINRFESKSEGLKQRLKNLNEHWDQLFFEIVARQLGFHVNSEPMERLARSIRIEWVQKMIDQPLSIEALFFGQAGMLNRSFEDDYAKELKKEYQFLQKKFDLTPMDPSTWKFARLRPSNFPTIRIAQLAGVFTKSPRFFSDCLKVSNASMLIDFFDVELNQYWNNHFRFDKESPLIIKKIGDESLKQLVLNTICLIWVLYGDYKSEEHYKVRALQIMEEMQGEKNRYVQLFDDCEYKFINSVQTQGLRFLWENYCDEKKCLTCSIGINGLKL